MAKESITERLRMAEEREIVLGRGKSIEEIISECKGLGLFDDTQTQLLRGVKNGDFYWDDALRIYGESLLSQLQELHPEIPMWGKFKAPIFNIKKGRGILSRLNPFAKKLVEIFDYPNYSSLSPKTITAHISMKNSIERIVPELESKTGEHFEVKYTF